MKKKRNGTMKNIKQTISIVLVILWGILGSSTYSRASLSTSSSAVGGQRRLPSTIIAPGDTQVPPSRVDPEPRVEPEPPTWEDLLSQALTALEDGDNRAIVELYENTDLENQEIIVDAVLETLQDETDRDPDTEWSVLLPLQDFAVKGNAEAIAGLQSLVLNSDNLSLPSRAKCIISLRVSAEQGNDRAFYALMDVIDSIDSLEEQWLAEFAKNEMNAFLHPDLDAVRESIVHAQGEAQLKRINRLLLLVESGNNNAKELLLELAFITGTNENSSLILRTIDASGNDADIILAHNLNTLYKGGQEAEVAARSLRGDSRAVEILKNGLRNGSEDVRIASALALGIVLDKGDNKGLLRNAAYNDESEGVKNAASRALARAETGNLVGSAPRSQEPYWPSADDQEISAEDIAGHIQGEILASQDPQAIQRGIMDLYVLAGNEEYSASATLALLELSLLMGDNAEAGSFIVAQIEKLGNSVDLAIARNLNQLHRGGDVADEAAWALKESGDARVFAILEKGLSYNSSIITAQNALDAIHAREFELALSQGLADLEEGDYKALVTLYNVETTTASDRYMLVKELLGVLYRGLREDASEAGIAAEDALNSLTPVSVLVEVVKNNAENMDIQDKAIWTLGKLDNIDAISALKDIALDKDNTIGGAQQIRALQNLKTAAEQGSDDAAYVLLELSIGEYDAGFDIAGGASTLLTYAPNAPFFNPDVEAVKQSIVDTEDEAVAARGMLQLLGAALYGENKEEAKAALLEVVFTRGGDEEWSLVLEAIDAAGIDADILLAHNLNTLYKGGQEAEVAAQALRKSNDPRTLAILESGLRNGNEAVRITSALALGIVLDKGDNKGLLRNAAYNDDSEGVKNAASRALARAETGNLVGSAPRSQEPYWPSADSQEISAEDIAGHIQGEILASQDPQAIQRGIMDLYVLAGNEEYSASATQALLELALFIGDNREAGNLIMAQIEKLGNSVDLAVARNLNQLHQGGDVADEAAWALKESGDARVFAILEKGFSYSIKITARNALDAIRAREFELALSQGLADLENGDYSSLTALYNAKTTTASDRYMLVKELLGVLYRGLREDASEAGIAAEGALNTLNPISVLVEVVKNNREDGDVRGKAILMLGILAGRGADEAAYVLLELSIGEYDAGFDISGAATNLLTHASNAPFFNPDLSEVKQAILDTEDEAVAARGMLQLLGAMIYGENKEEAKAAFLEVVFTRGGDEEWSLVLGAIDAAGIDADILLAHNLHTLYKGGQEAEAAAKGLKDSRDPRVETILLSGAQSEDEAVAVASVLALGIIAGRDNSRIKSVLLSIAYNHENDNIKNAARKAYKKAAIGGLVTTKSESEEEYWQ